MKTQDYTQEELLALRPWPESEERKLSRIATDLFRYDHGPRPTALVRDNCGACALQGYNRLPKSEGGGLNYAGWKRVFIQSNTFISRKKVLAALASENKAYVRALRRDLVTFGHNHRRTGVVHGRELLD